MQDPSGVLRLVQRGIAAQEFVDEELVHDGLRLSQPGIQLRWRALWWKKKQPPRCRVSIDGGEHTVERERERLSLGGRIQSGDCRGELLAGPRGLPVDQFDEQPRQVTELLIDQR